MRRVCFDCKLPFGDKCSNCGGTKVYLLCEDPRGVGNDLLACVGCPRTWFRNEDGETHGLCPACQRKAQHNLFPEVRHAGV